MCPNCYRGLTYPNKEVCIQCAGTGVWNPASLTASEVEIVMDEQAQAEEAVVAPEVEAPVETPEAPAEVEQPAEVVSEPAPEAEPVEPAA